MPRIAACTFHNHAKKVDFQHGVCKCMRNFAIWTRLKEERISKLPRNISHMKLRDCGGLKWLTELLVHLARFCMSVFEKLLKDA